MSDERAAMDQVGRYWDAVAQGDPAAGHAVDPALARTIQRVQGLAAAPAAEARERVWQSVMANAEAARRQEEGSLLRVLVPNGRALDVPGIGVSDTPPSGRQRWFLTQLATAALILLTLVGSFMVFGPGRVSRQEEPPVFIQAIEATPATPEAAEATVAEFLWSSEGGPGMPIGDPYFLTLDPVGNLWVPDGLNSRFQIFSPDGEFIETWGEPGSGDGQLDFVADPYGVGAAAFDAEGNLYVADNGNGRVQKFGPDRSFLAAWDGSESVEGRLVAPLDIAVGADGNVYVSDTDDDYVKVFDRDGRYLFRWGGLGASDGKFMEITGLTVDAAGQVWVVDAGEHRIQTFASDGAFMGAWGAYGAEAGEFRDPNDVAVDARGRVYVTDWENSRVQVFDGDGQFLAAWGEPGEGEGQFQGPVGIVLDAQGNAYVSDDGIDDILKFRLLPPLSPDDASSIATPEAVEAPVAEFLWHADGSPDLPFQEPNHPAIDPQGNIWVPDGWNSRFVIFAPDGTWLEDWGTEGSGEGEFQFENGGIGFGGVAFDGDGNIYVADSGNHRVQKFGPDRTFLTAWGEPGNGEGELQQPVALTVDGQGRVYVSDRFGSVEVFDSEGAWLASWDGLTDPVGITTDREGDVWVADEGMTRVFEFSSNGERLTTWDDFGSDDGQLKQPSGIDVDAEGRVFISDRGNRVQIFSPDGELLGSWGEFGIDPGTINGPYGVVVGEGGMAYVAEDYGQRLQAFRLSPPFKGDEVSVVATPVAAAGAVAEVVWETRGGPDMPLSYPGFLALDPEGNLWIPDSGNDRYQIFSPDGEFLEAWGETGSGDGQFEFERDLFHSSSIAFAPDGSFYVTDGGNFRVQKFGPDRDFVTAWGEEGSGPGQFDLMNGIAVDGLGRVYVTDDGRSDVQVFAADGSYLRTIGERGFNDGQFMFSMGSAVAIDPVGNVVVSDSSNQRLQTFSPDGEFLSMLAGGPREDELQQPNQVAIDGGGRIFVTSPHLRQVQVFAADGTYLGAIGTANPTAWAEGAIPSGEFLVPTGVALDGEGNIYVADYEDYRVQKFRLLPPFAPNDSSSSKATTVAAPMAAEFLWQSDGDPNLPLNDPVRVAIDPQGNVWVTDGRNSRFQIFSPDGSFLEAWGSEGSAPSRFDFVDPAMFGGYGGGAMAFDSAGNLYVVDSGNHRIQKFAPDRTFLTTWGGKGEEDGQFIAPTDLAIDAQGRVFVTDEGRDDVQVFDSEGRFLMSWGSPGDGWLPQPSGITIDADGNLWIAHFTQFRVQKYAPDGALLASVGDYGSGPGLFRNPSDVAVDSLGRLYVADWGGARVQVFDDEGEFVALWGDLGLDAGQFMGPNNAVPDGAGNVYVVEDGNDRIQKFRLLPPLAP